MFQHFTDRARRVMALANRQAQQHNVPAIDTVHILLGLLEDEGGCGVKALRTLGVDLRVAAAEADKLAERRTSEQLLQEKLPQTLAAKQIIVSSIAVARELGHNYVGTEHMTIALARDVEGPGPKVFGGFNVTAEVLRDQVAKMLRDGAPSAPTPAAKAWKPAYVRAIEAWLWVLTVAVVLLFWMILRR